MRPEQYNNIDGLGEVEVGSFVLEATGLMWLGAVVSRNPVWTWAVFAVAFFVVPGLLHRGIVAVKERVTYPRTGYVQYRMGPIRLRAALGGILAAGAGAACIWATRKLIREPRVDWSWLVMGCLLAAVHAFGAARQHRWKWIVSVVLALGSVGVAFVNPGGGMDSWRLGFAFAGAVFTISGGLSFWEYLRRTRAA